LRSTSLRSSTAPGLAGYAFDASLLPLPTPRCEPGRSSCDPVTALGRPSCPDKATTCESIEDYSARVFGLLSQQGPSHPEKSEAPAERQSRYGRDVAIEYESMFEGEVQTKVWTLPMLHSIDQVYLVMRRFFGDCWYLDNYEPPRQVDLSGCGGIGGANVNLTASGKGAVIARGFMD